MDLAPVIEEFRNAAIPAFYLGAGISRSVPSSVPLFSELMKAYVDALESDGNIIDRHAKQEAEDVRRMICELPAEEFFADLKFVFRDKALEPLDWMNAREPNRAHGLLAVLAKDLRVKTILTPNFDCLLEKVLPDYLSVPKMKTGYRLAKTQRSLTSDELPDYIPSSKPAIFHLHGTSIRSRLEITPAATAVQFDHFDHANLAPRLGGATLLVAGSSGEWDTDVIDLLKRCNIKRIVWITHDPKRHLTSAHLPEKWREIFSERGYAIRGDTTRILAQFAGKQLATDDDNDSGIFEFHDYVNDLFGTFDKKWDKWKIHTIVALVNKIWRGDIALSILHELEREYNIEESDEHIDEEREERFLQAVAACDSITLVDGRTLTPEQFLIEYHKKRDIRNRVESRRWPIIVGRDKAIAMSRNPNAEHQDIAWYLNREVIRRLEEVIPYVRIGPQEMRDYPWITREWLLAYESLGLFYLEEGKGKLAIECIEKAISICGDEEDLYRLQSTWIIAGCNLELSDILGLDEARLVDDILQRRIRETRHAKVEDLMEIANNCFSAGGRTRATAICEAITDTHPNNIEACLNYSNMLKAIGRRKDALGELSRGLEIEPNNYKLLCNKGWLFNQMGRQRQAIPVLKTALESNPCDELY